MSKYTLSFRKANQDDRPFLLKLRKSSMTEHLAVAGINMTDEQHLMRIDEFFTDSYIICKDEESIGLIKFSLSVEKIHIRQFQLLPAVHGMGIGSRVLKILKQKALQRHIPITLNVLLKNPALRLYQRHHFMIENENQLEYQMRWLNDKP